MPEGDTVAGHARRLTPVLVGKEVERVAGSSPSLRANAHRVTGRRVEAVTPVGKNLVIEISGGYSILIHLGMSGRWLVLDVARPVPGDARLVLSTTTQHAICLAAPTVIIDRSPRIERRLSSLGPDLAGGEWDDSEFLRRVRTRDDKTVSAMLLDQRVAAGIGNVFKSEVLFLQRVHPDTVVADLGDDALLALGRRARRLIQANVGRHRSTTGEGYPGRETWVYGRQGRPCRRCGSAIEMEYRHERVTYWCPSCQESQQRRGG